MEGWPFFTERFHDEVIANAVGLVGLEGSHKLRIHKTPWTLSTGKFRGRSTQFRKYNITQFRKYKWRSTNLFHLNYLRKMNAMALENCR